MANHTIVISFQFQGFQWSLCTGVIIMAVGKGSICLSRQIWKYDIADLWRIPGQINDYVVIPRVICLEYLHLIFMWLWITGGSNTSPFVWLNPPFKSITKYDIQVLFHCNICSAKPNLGCIERPASSVTPAGWIICISTNIKTFSSALLWINTFGFFLYISWYIELLHCS